jgi:chromate reductase
MNIIAFNGSLRQGSLTGQVIATMPEVAPNGMNIETIEIGHLPLYNDDLRVDGENPAEVTKIAEKLAAADGLIVASPEYNRSFSPAIKNVIDWLSKAPEAPLRGMPTLIATQSPGQLGGIAANNHLRQVLSICGAVFLTGGEIAVGASASKVEGGKITDQATRDFIASDLQRLADLIDRS